MQVIHFFFFPIFAHIQFPLFHWRTRHYLGNLCGDVKRLSQSSSKLQSFRSVPTCGFFKDNFQVTVSLSELKARKKNQKAHQKKWWPSKPRHLGKDQKGKKNITYDLLSCAAHQADCCRHTLLFNPPKNTAKLDILLPISQNKRQRLEEVKFLQITYPESSSHLSSKHWAFHHSITEWNSA